MDGWLVLYDIDERELWKQEPHGVRLEVQDNAHVVLYPTFGKAIWATDWLLMRDKPVHAQQIDSDSNVVPPR